MVSGQDAMACRTWSSGWKLMLRSGVLVASSHSCCLRVVGFWNSRHTGTPAGTQVLSHVCHVLSQNRCIRRPASLVILLA